MIKVPQARRDTLRSLAQAMLKNPDADPAEWLSIKGIGPWTISYAKMRGMSESDIWLAGDLGIQKALQQRTAPITEAMLSPWRSYATLQLWFNLPTKPSKKLKPADNKVQAADSKN
jgi:AraC family transcriptional regulator of adaptative response / DNA-3-methyladenine glycosylase II